MTETKRKTWLIALGTVVVLIVAVILLWDWNWFRPMAETMASARLHRAVHIGHLNIELGRQPLVVLDDVTVGNPVGDPSPGKLAQASRLSFRFDAREALAGRVVLPQITIDRLVGDLHSYGGGQHNWAIDTGKAGGPPPQLGQLIINDSTIHFVDPALKADFKATVNTKQSGAQGGQITVAATGTYGGQAIVSRLTGGSVLSLRDHNHAYPIDFDAKNGATHIHLKGTVDDPMTFAGAKLELDLSGDDLADLYPLTGIPIPPSPAYKLTGSLDVGGPYILFKNIQGTVGSSDLEGTVDVAPGKGRPYIVADLTSRRVVLADLAGFIGSAPGKEDAANTTNKQETAKQRQAQSGMLLPNTPINLPRLRSADLQIHYKGDHIDSTTTPIDSLEADIVLQDGKIFLQPVSFGIGDGAVIFNMVLDGKKDTVHATGKIQAKHIALQRVMENLKPFEGTGTFGGEADIDATGNSLAALMANGNGDVRLSMAGGELSAMLVDLAGLELGRAIYRYITTDKPTPIRCMVADMGLQQGIMSTKTFILDTGEAVIAMNGDLDFHDETMNLTLTTDAKHFSILSVKSPVTITGPMKKPSIGPDTGALAERGAPAAALGVLLTPIGALLATIELGGADDADCKGLIQKLNAAAAATPPPPKAAPGK